MTRLEIEDLVNLPEAILKISDGVIGAASCLVEVVKINAEVDPDSGLGDFGTIWFLDTIGIYGSEIYILWNDYCNRRTRDLILLVRACQLGFISHEEMKQAATEQNRAKQTQIDLDDLDQKVCARLPNFRRY